jgi:hypothetical protein
MALSATSPSFFDGEGVRGISPHLGHVKQACKQTSERRTCSNELGESSGPV